MSDKAFHFEVEEHLAISLQESFQETISKKRARKRAIIIIIPYPQTYSSFLVTPCGCENTLKHIFSELKLIKALCHKEMQSFDKKWLMSRVVLTDLTPCVASTTKFSQRV